MEENIYPVQYIKSLNGKSCPKLILFSNGLKYVVKFKNNRQGTKVLVNEYVVGHLANLLSLPVAPFRIVDISEEFIMENPDLAKHAFESGNQFASLYIDNCSPLKKKFLTRNKVTITNCDSLAGMIVFDHWVNNTDRGTNNILLEPYKGKFYLHMIDHANSFPKGFKWTKRTLKKKPREIVHRWCASQLRGQRNKLNSYLKKILNLPDEKIHEVVESIPENWDVSEKEKMELLTYIVKMNKVLPDLISKFKYKYM
jgi:hypothetical protein